MPASIAPYEALTRFDAPISPGRLFVQASMVGRLRELEVTRMAAAWRLPGHCRANAG